MVMHKMTADLEEARPPTQQLIDDMGISSGSWSSEERYAAILGDIEVDVREVA